MLDDQRIFHDAAAFHVARPELDRGVVDNGPHQRLALAQGMFGVFSVGDVAGQDDEMRQMVVAGYLLRHRQFEPAGAARQGQLELLAGRDAIVQCLVQGADTGVRHVGRQDFMHRPADQVVRHGRQQKRLLRMAIEIAPLDVQFEHQVGQGLQGCRELVLQGNQFAFLALALGDVRCHAGQADDLPLRIAQHLADDPVAAFTSVTEIGQDEFAGMMLAVCQKPVVASLHAGGQFAAKELSIRAPDDLAARPAKHQAGHFIGVAIHPVRILDKNGGSQLFKQHLAADRRIRHRFPDIPH